MVRLSISLLGTFQVRLYGQEVVGFDSDKVRALLAYLAIESDRPHRREALAGLLWPERPERTARHNLSQALFNLRTLLGDTTVADPLEPLLTADRQTIQFNVASDHWLDGTAFMAALDACKEHPHRRLDLCEPCIEHLHQATDLYRGSFLEGFSLGDAAPFEEWMLLQQERFHSLTVGALGRLARCHELRAEYEHALQYVRRHVQLEPWREDAHRQMMRLLAVAGQRNAALAQYKACRQILETELGVEPGEETTALYYTIRDEGELPADPSLPPHNLPAPYTSFIGREAELAEIDARLRDRDCRLLTLVGPGGSGKTRLALEAATDVLYADHGHGFSHGVYFGSLAPLQSPEAIVPAVAQIMGFAFHTGSDLRQQLLDYLRGKNMLLILDNAEHLLGEHLLGSHGLGERSMDPAQAARRNVAGFVTDLLQAASNVKVLVTSRVRLNVRGEHLLSIPGMDVPATTPTDRLGAAPEDMTRYSAVRLFLESAHRVRSGFQPTQSDLAHIGHICRLVQGMPLGILLAAAWMRMLSPADIAGEIAAQVPEHGIDFLEAEWPDVPQRQRSMRAVFDHSWHLLAPKEQAAFQELSVFRGGLTWAAAQQVTGISLRELMHLVDRSLLHQTPPGRYEIHELLRQYAAQRLCQSSHAAAVSSDPEGAAAHLRHCLSVHGKDCVATHERHCAAVRNRHCAYYARFLQDREASLIGREQGKALAEIEAEIDNVRAAWDWAVAQGRIEDIDRALGSLAEFYHIRAWFQEGEEAFARAAQRLAKEQPEVRSRPGAARRSELVWGKVLARQGWFCDSLGLVEQASKLLRKSLGILRELDARREIAYALSYLGRVFAEEGSPQHEQALDILRKIGDQRGIAVSLHALGWNLIPQGEYEAARRRLQESLTLYRELGNRQGMADALGGLGYVTWVLGEFEAAKRIHQESYALSHEVGDQGGVALSLARWARDACGLQEYEEAKQLYGQSLALFREIGNLAGMAMVLGDLSELATVLGQYTEARQLAHRSLAMDEQLRYPVQKAWASRVLGNAARELDDLRGAREYLRQALEIGISVQAIAPALLTVVGIAALLMREGQKAKALELLALVLSHPSTWQWTKDRAAPLVAELKAALSPELFAAAQERGRARDLDTTVKELLVELEGAES